jgi:predicted site-specific integrase-resolvase
MTETPTVAEIKEQTPVAFRLNDAAKLLGVSRGSLYVLHKAGRLTLVSLAGRTLVPATELNRLIETAPKLAA